jgi:non-ribosomal peptide synthetase component F
LRNGEIEFLGRVDRQIKISGVRIEPGEIEAALRAHPEVADAVVIARPAPNGSLRLCAYYVSHGSGCTPSDLRRFVRRTLPRSMTPEVFVRLESFPLTANAKLDRERLPEPSEVPAQEPERSSLPETDLQQRVRAAWASVLSGSFGIDDNFFDVGGSSLRMVELQAIFREELGSEVPIARLFEYPTVRSFASWLEERGTPSGATGAPPPRELAERRRGLQQQAERQRLARERVRDE